MSVAPRASAAAVNVEVGRIFQASVGYRTVYRREI